MTIPQITIMAILAGLFGLLVWGRWRYDVVAFAALLAAVLAGLVPAPLAFSGFSHPATITVALVLILSRALVLSGATDLIARVLEPAARDTATHIAAGSGLGAALSSFMNNVGTLGLLMPVIMQTARSTKRPVGLLLMPLSFGCILGGLVTLIGTPSNSIVAAYRDQVAERPFAMFDFAPVGLVLAVAGVAFVALVGWRLIPRRGAAEIAADDLFDIDTYLAEARVPEDSKAVGKTARELEIETKDIDARIVGVIRQRRRTVPPGRLRVRADDVLMIEASPQNLDGLVAALGQELSDARGREILTGDAEAELVEAVVAPGARLIGRTLESLRLRRSFAVNILAVSRQGTPHRERLGRFRCRVGDVLLLHGDAELVAQAIANLGCLPLRRRAIRLGRPATPALSIAIFAAAIVLASVGILAVPIALGAAVLLMVIANIVPLRELYEAVDWPVIVLLGALIPVGGALETTGATTLITEAILWLTAGLSPVTVLVLLLVVTMTVSDILNNAATAVVMAPIAFGLAQRLGVNPDAFLMAVAIGASSAFLTPIGHQNNALVMGPGAYRFGDYWRMGLPLEILIVAVATPMILIVWPL